MPQVTPLGLLRPFFTDKCGKLLVGGKVFTYEANSLTPKITYADSDGLMPNTNPVILDKSGEADIYLDGNYRFQIFNRFGVLIHDINNIRDHFKDQIQNFFTGNILAAGGLPENSSADYNYLMQRLAQIAVDKGWDASFVTTASDQNQQQINDFGGAKWHAKVGGYKLGATVKLDNGDTVKSTSPTNTANPNVDMTGWFYTEGMSVTYPDKFKTYAGGDWTKAIKDAIASLGSSGGCVTFSAKTYKTSSNIDVPANVSLRGVSRGASIIQGSSNHHGLTFKGERSEITGLTIRDMQTGVVGGDGRYCKVWNCVISYNRIGFDWRDGYINTMSGNNIVFNTYGGLILGQSYQFNFFDNVVDNNLGGLGLLISGSPGCVIEKNTIEGNRNITTGHGVGIILGGFPQRVAIKDNWFEVNGLMKSPVDGSDNPYSVDILMCDGVSDVGVTLINSCVPEELRAGLLGNLSINGNIEIDGNFHFQSSIGIHVRIQSSPMSVRVKRGTFVGHATFGSHKVINIIYASRDSERSKLQIGDYHVAVQGGNTNTLLTGIGNTYVHCDNVTPYDFVTLDGLDLFTKKLTCEQFLSLPKATLSMPYRLPTSGYASVRNEVRYVEGTQGLRTFEGTGRVRAGAAPVLTAGQKCAMVFIGSPKSIYYPVSASGVNPTRCLVIGAKDTFNIIKDYTPTSSEVTVASGDFFGYSVMTESEYVNLFAGVRRLQLIDFQAVPDVTKAAAPPTEAARQSTQGDIIYNSAPTSGSAVSWVCVASGAPGTWQPTYIIP